MSRGRLFSGTTTLSRAHQTWRVTTAARVFALAMAVGLGLSNGVLRPSIATLLALCILAAIMSTVELDVKAAMPVVPVAEAALTALILGSPDSAPAPLVVYLAVPPLVAGLRHGVVSALNTIAAEALAIVGIVLAGQDFDAAPQLLSAAMPWIVVGLGVGLLAAWMRGSARALESAQAPYVSAHRLLSQLRRVSRQLPTGLDSLTIADFLVDATRTALGGRRTAILVGASSDAAVLLAQCGDDFRERLEQDPGVRRSWSDGSFHQRVLPKAEDGHRDRVVLPARVGERIIGVVVVDGPTSLAHRTLEDAQLKLDEHSLRLDTAMLFDDVRSHATDEERNRLAREIHDGIAQEIASLGYMVDDLAAGTDSVATKLAAIELREELSRLVGELRLSIFDLRHGVSDETGLGRALTEYAREVGSTGDLRVHLDLQESPASLRREVETELLRIAQEAITNARKHAHAANLWVRLSTKEGAVSLRVEDDGLGFPETRKGHYGLDTMRERAERIGAQLKIDQRSGGGTVVAALFSSPSGQLRGPGYVDHRAAR